MLQISASSTASEADIASLADNGMDDLTGDAELASYRYIRLVIYSARNLLALDRSGFSDP